MNAARHRPDAGPPGVAAALTGPWTSFDGHHRLVAGSPADNALAVKRALAAGASGPVLTFDDATGRVVDLDTRGSDAEVRARYAAAAAPAPAPAASPTGEPTRGDAAEGPSPRGRGRPRLGVVAREVTLLPRHWDWLAAQPGGASVTLRRLVEAARRDPAQRGDRRLAQERAWRVMTALAGDLPGFEEATRALFAGDDDGLRRHTAAWPADVRDYACTLAIDTPPAPGPAPAAIASGAPSARGTRA